MPDLQAKLAALQEELVREREAVKEIEACDVDELKQLRIAIAEQEYVSVFALLHSRVACVRAVRHSVSAILSRPSIRA